MAAKRCFGPLIFYRRRCRRKELVMRYPIQYLSCKGEKGVANLYCGDAARCFRILGAAKNVVLSDDSKDFIKLISLELSAGQTRGLMAVNIEQKDLRQTSFFLEVVRKNDKVEVLLGRIFVPPAGRLAQIRDGGTISVAVNEAVYTNRIPPQPHAPGARYVLVDGNTLCCYINEQIDEDELAQAALKHVAVLENEEMLRQYAQRVADLRQALFEQNKSHHERMTQMIREFKTEQQLLVARLRKFSSVLSKRWFISDKMLEEFKMLLPEE